MGFRIRSPHDWREWRRVRALQLKEQGWSQRQIAAALDASEGAVSQWLGLAESDGPEALLAHPAPGRPPRLSAAQKRMIPEFLWHGPESYGLRGEVWTRARVARVIEEEFGIRYHRGHVGRLLEGLGWTPQVPIVRASQRDDLAVEAWRRETWPRLVREARRERRALVLADEAGFYLMPGKVRTYAPAGETPTIRAKCSRDHLSVMAGITPQGKVYTLTRQQPLTGLHAIEFLVHLGWVAGDRLLVIWDGSPIHRRAAVKQFVSETGGKVRLESLPPYAPDLNPWDAGAWQHLKHVELRNVAFPDLEELHMEFHLAIGRLRKRTSLIRSFFEAAGLGLE
jgi:transposase